MGWVAKRYLFGYLRFHELELERFLREHYLYFKVKPGVDVNVAQSRAHWGNHSFGRQGRLALQKLIVSLLVLFPRMRTSRNIV